VAASRAKATGSWKITAATPTAPLTVVLDWNRAASATKASRLVTVAPPRTSGTNT
jgi:hypothetical protein